MCFSRNANNLKEEKTKLNNAILNQSYKLKAQQIDVCLQVSIGSSWMANEANNKGSIGKFYKEMFPSHNQNQKKI